MAKGTAELESTKAGEDELAQWADSPLAQFLAAGWRNTVRSFSGEAERYRTLAEVDAVFRTLVGDAEVNQERVSAAACWKRRCKGCTYPSARSDSSCGWRAMMMRPPRRGRTRCWTWMRR
jgi:hypothetical protein